MSTQRSFLRPQVLRIVASSGAYLLASNCTRDKSKDAESIEDSNVWRKIPISHELFGQRFQQVLDRQCSLLSSFEPNRTSMQGLASNTGSKSLHTRTSDTIPPKKTLQYDFVVVGYGNAGESAVKILKEKCPKATIAVVDPLRSAKRDNEKFASHSDFVTGFNPSERTVQILSDPSTQLHYRYGILVATGSRGAPPPLELFQESSLRSLLELRTTELVGNKKRPVLPPHEVRRRVLRSASKGEKIAILGSGWDAVDLACAAAQQNRGQVAGRDHRTATTLVFGSPGPAWHVLPQYLSSELRKKMRKQGIEIQDRSIGKCHKFRV